MVCGKCGTKYYKFNSTGRWHCGTKVNQKEVEKHRGKERRPGRGVSDEEVRKAVKAAYGMVGEKREELVRFQERIRLGPVTKIDELLAGEISEENRVDLEKKRALYMDKWVKVQIILDESNGNDEGGKCVDAEDFWKRTAHTKKDLDRLVEKIVVEDNGLRVIFVPEVEYFIGA